MVTDKVAVDVDIALEKPIGYFSLVRTVTFNVPEGSRPAEFEVFVGFDRATAGAPAEAVQLAFSSLKAARRRLPLRCAIGAGRGTIPLLAGWRSIA